ncbi:hypothetical protein ACFXKI_00750 [Streptomyces mirabilis]|uniref:hypothetical protein n=1 Tax=Streptomyces mirabilis TaxID=68239 RepID=UPI0036A4C831
MASEYQRVWNRRSQNAQGPWRASKLTTEQRADITQRLADGETPIDLAVEYGVTASRIRQLR